MRVVIDGRGIMNQLDGIGRYSLNLINELVETSRDISFDVIVRTGLRQDLLEQLPRGAQLHTFPHSHISINSIATMGPFVDRFHADLFHGLFLFQPLFMRTPGIITIYDTMWFQRPRLQARGKPFTLAAGWLYYRTLTALSVRKAMRIVAISESTRRDIVECFPSASNKVVTVEVGLDPGFNSVPAGSESGNEDLSRLGLGNNLFFLHVSNAKPYKNTDRVIAAFARIAPDTDHNLVIIGRTSAFSKSIHCTIHEFNLADRVRFLGSVSDGEVIALMKAAVSLVFPSLYEGFGLPVLEAMAVGCPVITSERGSLKEVAGDAALLVDPESTDAIAQRMLELIHNDSLRKSLSERGRRQASKFTWNNAAQTVIEMYNSMVTLKEDVVRVREFHHQGTKPQRIRRNEDT